ncbi:hypothetical protein, partial [Brachyspira hyodysenteriae]|uniref:hypothetical protein n=1 Tax=Brachyspira hyodysenteriae TaxID=159 RepID=UPI001C8FC992
TSRGKGQIGRRERQARADKQTATATGKEVTGRVDELYNSTSKYKLPAAANPQIKKQTDTKKPTQK